MHKDWVVPQEIGCDVQDIVVREGDKGAFLQNGLEPHHDGDKVDKPLDHAKYDSDGSGDQLSGQKCQAASPMTPAEGTEVENRHRKEAKGPVDFEDPAVVVLLDEPNKVVSCAEIVDAGHAADLPELVAGEHTHETHIEVLKDVVRLLVGVG